jgi:AcrR family transcriptional regulator
MSPPITSAKAAKPRGRRPSVEDFDVREHMLDAATRLFAERGIAATTVAQIAADVGVTSAMVHYYFTNREQLLDAVVGERIMRAVEFVWGPMEESLANDPFAFAGELVARLFDATERMPWLPPLWLREIVSEGGLLRERMIERIPVEQVKRFAVRIGEAQGAGIVTPGLEPAFLFHSIIALVMLPLATAKIWHRAARGLPQFDRTALQRHVGALLVSGMQPPAARPRSARASREKS